MTDEELKKLASMCTGDCESCEVNCTGKIHHAYDKNMKENYNDVTFYEPCCLDVIVHDYTEHFIFKPKWTVKEDEVDIWYSLTLKDIYEQVQSYYDEKYGYKGSCPVIMVIYESGLNGYIYECNNYNQGEWVLHGTTKGYA